MRTINYVGYSLTEKVVVPNIVLSKYRENQFIDYNYLTYKRVDDVDCKRIHVVESFIKKYIDEDVIINRKSDDVNGERTLTGFNGETYYPQYDRFFIHVKCEYSKIELYQKLLNKFSEERVSLKGENNIFIEVIL